MLIISFKIEIIFQINLILIVAGRIVKALIVIISIVDRINRMKMICFGTGRFRRVRSWDRHLLRRVWWRGVNQTVLIAVAWVV